MSVFAVVLIISKVLANPLSIYQAIFTTLELHVYLKVFFSVLPFWDVSQNLLILIPLLSKTISLKDDLLTKGF